MLVLKTATNPGIAEWLPEAGGGGDLAATLVLGNITGGTDIIVTNTDLIKGEDAAAASGLAGYPLILRGGSGDGVGVRGPVVLEIGTNSAIQADTTGNVRGVGAVDLQASRAAVDQVASGARSVILGGRDNKASGSYSIAGGRRCYATGTRSIALGYRSDAYGTNDVAIGAFNYTSTAGTSLAIGASNVILANRGAGVGYRNGIYSTATKSTAVGYRNKIYSTYAVALGRTNLIGALATQSLAVGAFHKLYAKKSAIVGYGSKIYNSLGTSYGNTSLGIFGSIERPTTPQSGSTPYGVATAGWKSYLLPRGESIGTTIAGWGNLGMSSYATNLGFDGVGAVDGSMVISSGRDHSASGPANAAENGPGDHQVSISPFGGATRGAATTILKVSTSDGAVATAGYMVLRQQTSLMFRILVVARQVEPSLANGPVVVGTLGDSASWEFNGLCKRDEYTQSTGTITVTGGTAGDTITISGIVLTAVNGTAGALQYNIAGGVSATIAARIATAINLVSNGIKGVYIDKASAVGNVITLVAYPLGTLGDAVTLARSNPATIALSGANLTGGADTTVTRVGISAAGATAPTYNDAGAATWTVEVNVDAVKQSLDIICVGQAGKYIKWEAMVLTSEAHRSPWNY